MAAALDRAVSLHRDGAFEAAERLYLGLIDEAPGHLAARHMLGVLRHQQGRNDEAADLLAAVLAAAPDWPDALINHGSVLMALGRHEDAIAVYARACELQPTRPEAHYSLGRALTAAGRLDDALQAYDEALRLRPAYSAALRDRADALFALDRHAEAVAGYGAVLAHDPNRGEILNNRGTALTRLQQDEAALADYERALALRPDWPEALYNRAATLARLDRSEAAVAGYDAALAQRPQWPDALYNRALALMARGRDEDALADLDRALALRSDWKEAVNHRAAALQRLGRAADALIACADAIEHWPDDPVARVTAGLAAQSLGRFEEGIALFEQALSLDPECVEAHICLGAASELRIAPDAATRHYEAALALRPQHLALRFRLCMAQLPPLYREAAEPARRRRAYVEKLEDLCEAVRRSKGAGEPAGRNAPIDLTDTTHPFYLPYQGENDRELQRRFGELVCGLAADWPTPELPAPAVAGEPVRLGLVSGYFRRHTVWKLLLRGWVGQLDRRRFRVFLYHTARPRDGETAEAAALAERFVQGPLPIAAWREAILADRPHVLFYPEIGMDPVAAWLAAQRLAPVQCVAWGHPNTTGYPSLDYFLSSALMEPAEAQQHYTERVILLPGLSLYYEPPKLPPVAIDRGELGLRPGATVYWCGQSLFKYLPQDDRVFPEIARGAGNCQFVFYEYQYGPAGTELFRDRLAAAFARSGLDLQQYCVFLPRADLDRFIATIGLCDVILDSIGWSGGNSTLESLEQALPIVTLPGRFMRGRHSAAILEAIGVTETIASDLEDYVAIAIRLAHDIVWRQALRQRIAAGRHRVYRDEAPISALERFFDLVARGGEPPADLLPRLRQRLTQLPGGDDQQRQVGG